MRMLRLRDTGRVLLSLSCEWAMEILLFLAKCVGEMGRGDAGDVAGIGDGGRDSISEFFSKNAMCFCTS